MQVRGKVLKVMEPVSGVSQTGNPWKRQEFVIECETTSSFQTPRKTAFTVSGEDRINRIMPQVGDLVDVYFEIDAHEYNGRWFNEIRSWDVRKVNAQTPAPTETSEGDPFATPKPIDLV